MPLEVVDNEREHGPSLVSVAALRLTVHWFTVMRPGASIMNDWWPSVIEGSAKPWVLASRHRLLPLAGTESGTCSGAAKRGGAAAKRTPNTRCGVAFCLPSSTR
jgi:hypothetical protein